MNSETFFEKLIEYYRKKRILKILTTYYKIQPQPFSQDRRVPLFSRDSRIHFLLCLSFILILSVPAKVIAIAFPKEPMTFLLAIAVTFLSVELADFVLLRFTKSLDFLFDLFFPLIGLIAILGLVVGLKFFNLGAWGPEQLKNWRTTINEKIRSGK